MIQEEFDTVNERKRTGTLLADRDMKKMGDIGKGDGWWRQTRTRSRDDDLRIPYCRPYLIKAGHPHDDSPIVTHEFTRNKSDKPGASYAWFHLLSLALSPFRIATNSRWSRKPTSDVDERWYNLRNTTDKYPYVVGLQECS